MLEVNNFNAIRISLASPEQIRDWSKGEVTKPETINYRTLRPEKDGLFDERIFGPTRDWECYCGKYKRIRYKGIICDKCGVEVTRAKVRRERMGHIQLASPVSHIWYFKGTPSRLGILLDISPRNLERILYFALYIVTWVDEDARARLLQQLDEEAEGRGGRGGKALADLEDSLRADLHRQQDELNAGLKQLKAEREEERAQRTADLVAAQQADEGGHGCAAGPRHGRGADRLRADRRGRRGEPARRPTGRPPDAPQEGGRRGDRARQRRDASVARRKRRPASPRRIADLRLADGRRAWRRSASGSAARPRASRRRSARRTDEIQRLQPGAMLPETVARRLELPRPRPQVRLRRPRRPAALRGRHGRGGGPRADPAHGPGGPGHAAAQRGAHHLRAASQEGHQAPAPHRGVPPQRHAAGVDDPVGPAGDPAGPAADGPAGRRPLRHVRPERPLPPRHQPQQPPQAAPGAGRAGDHHPQREAHAPGGVRRPDRQRPPWPRDRRHRQPPPEEPLATCSRASRAGSARTCSASASTTRAVRSSWSGPELKLHQCGLPKKMALELFKPFVMRQLVEKGFAHNIKSAKRIVERVRPEVWDVLEDVIKDHPVLLNRAPTLHRLGIQAFMPVLVEGSAIQIHPLVCSAFNADFDGDQMAVHVPLSRRSAGRGAADDAVDRQPAFTVRREPGRGADPGHGPRLLLPDPRSRRTSRSSRSGSRTSRRPCSPTKSGASTRARTSRGCPSTTIRLLALHSRHRDRRPCLGRGAWRDDRASWSSTTIGRLIFNQILPDRLRFLNRTMNRGALRELVERLLPRCSVRPRRRTSSTASRASASTTPRAAA